MHLQTNLRYVLFVTALIRIFISPVSCLPSDPCKYTSDLLYGSKVESSFTGEIFRIANDPPSESLSRFQPLIRCFIPAQFEQLRIDDIFSIRTLTNPAPLSTDEQHFMCVFGCLRFLYFISSFSNEPSDEDPINFYVLIVSERKNMSCIDRNESNPEIATHSVKQYDTERGLEQYHSSNSIITTDEHDFLASNLKFEVITPKTPNLIKNVYQMRNIPKCIPPQTKEAMFWSKASP